MSEKTTIVEGARRQGSDEEGAGWLGAKRYHGERFYLEDLLPEDARDVDVEGTFEITVKFTPKAP